MMLQVLHLKKTPVGKEILTEVAVEVVSILLEMLNLSQT